MTYSIHDSKTGEVLINRIELDETQTENVSADNAEGHFQANLIDELSALGERSVYAILH